MRIHVEEKHITAGRRNSSGRCPIALAIKEQLGVHRVNVSKYYVEFNKNVASSKLSQRARNFVADFDLGGKSCVKPFSFQL